MIAGKRLLAEFVCIERSGACSGCSARGIIQVFHDNDQTGHHVPTDSPLRQMILLIQAEGPGGEPLALVEGPTLPDWVGVGDSVDGYYAGLPGKAYAKILMELWTEISPTGAYWNPTRIVSDNRLAAFESDTTTYTFALPSDDKASVKVTLLFRRTSRKPFR